MIAFEQPAWLALAVVWAAVIALLAWWQGPPLEWIARHVAARHRRRLTRYSRRGVIWHALFLFLLGALLLVAAAGPYRVVAGEKKVSSHTVVLLLDASLSMGAADIEPHPGAGEAPSSRFEQATGFAAELIEAMPDAAFGLVSFSGVTVVHSPPTRDHRALIALLETLSYHVDLTLSGTRFSTAFDAVIHMVQHQPGSYQAVILSDGELPQGDLYDEALEVLTELSVPVHTVALGTLAGEDRVIYEPADVINNVEEKRVARRYHTSRVDRELAAIAEATGGRSAVAEQGEWVGTLLPAIRDVEPTEVLVAGRDSEDLSHFPLAVFLAGFLIETLLVCRRPRRDRADPTPRRGTAHRGTPHRGTAGGIAGPSPAVVVLLLASLLLLGCGPRILKAHWHNDKGIDLFENGEHDLAEARFEKAKSYRVREHVPLYNLGKNSAAVEEYAVAHDFFQEAILVEPRLAKAYFNDGHALYGWGEQEIDLEECRFDRARQLWDQAAKRFRRALELAGEGSDLGGRAARDAEAVDEALAALETAAETCAPPPPPPGSGGAPPPPPESGEPPPESGEPPPESGEPPPESGEPPPESGEPPPESGEPPPPSEGQEPPPPGEPPPGGGGGGQSDSEEGQGPAGGGGLSGEEQEEVRAALERIRKESETATGYRQSAHQQITQDTVGRAAGRELWW